MLEAGGSAAALIRNKARLLEEFRRRVRARIEATRPESTPMIIDTLPGFLTRLALALIPGSELSFASEYSNIAAQHGNERARFTNYALKDVIHEYQVLREVLMEGLRDRDTPSEHDWNVIHRSIDEAIAESAASFVRVHENYRELFTAALSHDFRGPLANATNYVELMRRNVEPARHAHFAARALHNLRQIARMIGALLDVAQSNASSGLKLHVQAAEAVSLARDVIEDMSSSHGDRFVLYATGEVHGHWDGDRLKQAIHNLMENAVKYGRANTPISIRVETSRGRLRMSCHNEGEPIPPEVLPELFRPFKRAGSASASATPGWGLGLMLVETIAEAHGGGVDVESSRELGTTFTIDVLCDARAIRQ